MIDGIAWHWGLGYLNCLNAVIVHMRAGQGLELIDRGRTSRSLSLELLGHLSPAGACSDHSSSQERDSREQHE